MKQLILADELVGPWVAKRSGANYLPNHTRTIGLVQDGEIIAGVLYEGFNHANINMHVAAVGSRWLNREFLYAAFDYPFNQLGVKRVTGLVPSDNLLARRFDEHLGFKQEAVLIDGYPGGDLLVYSMHRHQCRWLNLRKTNVNTSEVESKQHGIIQSAGAKLGNEPGNDPWHITDSASNAISTGVA